MIRKLADKGGLTGINFCSDFIKTTSHTGNTFTYVDDIVKHIKYIRNVGGLDVIALGTDFDGIPSTLEIKDASQIQNFSRWIVKKWFKLLMR